MAEPTKPTKTDAEVQWELDRRLLHDAILAAPPGHPGREQMVRDYARMHRDRYGEGSVVVGGGAHLNTKSSKITGTISRSSGLQLYDVRKKGAGK